MKRLNNSYNVYALDEDGFVCPIAQRTQRITVTRKKVAGIEVVFAAVLLF